MYADLWPGEVMVLGPPAETSDTSNLGAVTLDAHGLPYRVETTTDLVGGLGAVGADVALLPLDERFADLVGVAGRTVFAAEHTGRSRLEMLLVGSVPPLDRLRAEIGFRRLTPRLKRLVSRADGVQCNGQVAWLAYAGHSPAPLRMYDSRVRLADVHRARGTNEPWSAGRTLRLGFSGRLIPIKGPEYAIAAYRQLRAAGLDVSLEMFGDGELRGRLEQEAPDVRFHGSLDFATEWCPTVASSIDLMVLPHVQSDPAGTYLESAGMGVPVVGFDNVALDHLVEVAGLGWTSPPRRADLLAGRIQELMATPAELPRARDAGRAFMEDHCFEKDFGARVQHLHDVLRSGVE